MPFAELAPFNICRAMPVSLTPVEPEAVGAVSNDASAAPPRMPPVPKKLCVSKLHSARVAGGVAVCVDVAEVVGVVLGVLVEVEVLELVCEAVDVWELVLEEVAVFVDVRLGVELDVVEDVGVSVGKG